MVVDGMRVNDPNGNGAGWNLIPMERIMRFESRGRAGRKGLEASPGFRLLPNKSLTNNLTWLGGKGANALVKEDSTRAIDAFNTSFLPTVFQNPAPGIGFHGMLTATF